MLIISVGLNGNVYADEDKWFCYGHRNQNFMGMNYLSILEIDFKKEILKNFWGFNPPNYDKYAKVPWPKYQYETPTREMFKRMKDENKFDIFLVKKHNEDALYVRFDIIDKNENKIRYIIEKKGEKQDVLINKQKGKFDDENHDFGGLTREEKYRVRTYKCSKNKKFNPY